MRVPKQHECTVPVIKEPPPQRPNTLLQRLSSGIVHVIPSLRASSSRNDLIDRSTAASGLSGQRARKGTVVAESEQLLVPEPETIASTETAQPCPYDPNSHKSFASIEKRRCSFCGMRGPKIIHNEPCHACKTGGADSHIISDRRHLSTHRGYSAIGAGSPAQLANSSDSLLLGPRPVTPERAAKRIGNPPRVSKLPPGIVRLPASDATQNTQHLDPVARPPSRLGMGLQESETHGVYLRDSHGNGSGSSTKKPDSPKLHHLHGLSRSENYPFVHRHEISEHAIALRAGSSRPLTDHSNNPRRSPNVRESPDFSNTVYYGGRRSPLPPNRSGVHRPQVTTVIVKQVHASGSAAIDLRASPLDTALTESGVYKKRSFKQTSAEPSQVLKDITDSSTTFDSQDTGSTKLGGMRLELKGGSLSSSGIPKLRGGSGHERVPTNTFSFKLKRWILLCHGPCPKFDDDSDDDLPPPRVVTPARVAEMRQKMNGTAPLPAHLCKGASSIASSSSTGQTRPGTEGLLPATTFTTTISGPPKRSLSCRLSSALSLPTLFHCCSESPINQPALVTPVRVLTPPFPHLRGGAKSPGNIPPTLFWLTGGTGRQPISFSGWKQSRPKQRMGGLFGMAIFGDKYGKEYRIEAKVVGDVEVECSASVEVTVGDTVSLEEVQGGTDASSANSSSLSVSSRSEPVKQVAGGMVEVVPAEPVQRAPSPPLLEFDDDVPLCSGALPVELTELVPSDDATPSISREGSDKKDDTVVLEEKKA